MTPKYPLLTLMLALWSRQLQAFSQPSFFSTRIARTQNSKTVAASSTIASDVSTKTIEFKKYHGLGNDFILIDDRDKVNPSLSPEQSERLCNRNFGIGADGVIFALKPPSEQFDFRMRIYNSDGTEPEMCGNGIRCMARFLKDLGEDAKTYNIDTLAGNIVPVMNDDGSITVDMGEPILEASKVPTTLTANTDNDSVVEQTYECNGKTWKISAVSMGNPHAIIFVDDLDTSCYYREILRKGCDRRTGSRESVGIPRKDQRRICASSLRQSPKDEGLGTRCGTDVGLWYRSLCLDRRRHSSRQNTTYGTTSQCSGHLARW